MILLSDEMQMKKVWIWLCKHLLNWEWTLVKKEVWQNIRKGYEAYEHQFKPEAEILVETQLKSMDSELLLAVYREIKSTKNALLIEQKRYSDPIAIAHRDGAIITVDIMLQKIAGILRQKKGEEEFYQLEKE